MKVLYDHQAFTGLPYGGVPRYFFELMRSFAKWPEIDFELSLRLSNNEYLEEESFSNHLRYKRFSASRNANRLASLLNRLYSMQRVQAGKFDVFHPTYYHRYFLNAVGNKPFVITFHDAASERYAKEYPDLGEGLYELKKQLLRRADAIISVSEYSKQEILRYFSVEPDKIKVIHLGTRLKKQASEKVPMNRPIPMPYLLYVGKRGLYKNFNGFFRAIQPVLQRHPDLHLVCAGGGPFTHQEQSLFYASRLSDRVLYRSASDENLLKLYQHARAFVFPSLNEGFGIPVLEAFGNDCPVVLSNCSSLPEVAAEAALYFDPEDDDSVADAIERIVTDDVLCNELRQKGTERLRDFSCDKTARQTLDVYQSLA
ncbi:hypothetical protein GCM10028807_33390 [Spirosoma daeguense]